MPLKCTSISSARAARQRNKRQFSCLPSTVHASSLAHIFGKREKEHPGLDHIGTEMLVLD
jgi:hypothetical protein